MPHCFDCNDRSYIITNETPAFTQAQVFFLFRRRERGGTSPPVAHEKAERIARLLQVLCRWANQSVPSDSAVDLPARMLALPVDRPNERPKGLPDRPDAILFDLDLARDSKTAKFGVRRVRRRLAY